MKTVVSLVFLLSTLLLVTGSAFAKVCQTDLCYQVIYDCDPDFTAYTYFEACLNGDSGSLLGPGEGYCFGEIPLRAFGDSGGFNLNAGRVFLGGSEFDSCSCDGEWFFEFNNHNMRNIDGIINWQGGRCTVKGTQVPLSNCVNLGCQP